MNTLTPGQIRQMQEARRHAFMINGHISYQRCFNKALTHNIEIIGLAPELGAPTGVAFQNPDLINTSTANDADNPDGVKFPLPIIQAPIEKKPVKKKTTLRLVK